MSASESSKPNPGEACPLCGRATEETPEQLRERLRHLFGDDISRRMGWIHLPESFLLSVVIPVYNECDTVAHILEHVRAVPIPKEIILVDDGSTDGSREKLRSWEEEPGLRICLHERNRGKGAAVRTGFAQATGDIVIIQDADMEYDPREYPSLIGPIVDGHADVVFGSRFLTDGPHRVLYYWHSIANRALTTLSNMFTDLNLTDMETCYKVFRREVIEDILPVLKEEGFGIEPEITAKVARRRYRIYEQGISYHGRTYSEGKKIGMRDALGALRCILRYCWFD